MLLFRTYALKAPSVCILLRVGDIKTHTHIYLDPGIIVPFSAVGLSTEGFELFGVKEVMCVCIFLGKMIILID